MNASGTPASPGSRLGAGGLIALLVASLVLGLLVYRARTPDLALEVTSFPRALDENGTAEFEFFVRFSDPAATIEVVGRDQVIARTLADSFPVEEEARITCVWDGRDDSGDRVEEGRYRLRVTLPDSDRVMVFPLRLKLDWKDPGQYTLGFGEVCEVAE